SGISTEARRVSAVGDASDRRGTVPRPVRVLRRDRGRGAGRAGDAESRVRSVRAGARWASPRKGLSTSGRQGAAGRNDRGVLRLSCLRGCVAVIEKERPEEERVTTTLGIPLNHPLPVAPLMLRLSRRVTIRAGAAEVRALRDRIITGSPADANGCWRWSASV